MAINETGWSMQMEKAVGKNMELESLRSESFCLKCEEWKKVGKSLLKLEIFGCSWKVVIEVGNVGKCNGTIPR